MTFLLALNIAGATPLSGNDETQAELEEAALLPLVAGISGNDISRIPFACRAPSSNKAQAEAVRPGEEAKPGVGQSFVVDGGLRA